jgi:Rubisco LSMT substrate-binding
VTSQGFDSRLLQAVEGTCRCLHDGTGKSPPSGGELCIYSRFDSYRTFGGCGWWGHTSPPSPNHDCQMSCCHPTPLPLFAVVVLLFGLGRRGEVSFSSLNDLQEGEGPQACCYRSAVRVCFGSYVKSKRIKGEVGNVVYDGMEGGGGGPGMLLQKRCAALLREFPTTLEEDQQLIAQGGLSPNMLTAVRFRAGKKTILLTALASFE